MPANAEDTGDAGLILRSGRSPGGKWQPTPVFFSEKSHGQRSLEGYSPKGRKESGTRLSDQVHPPGRKRDLNSH